MRSCGGGLRGVPCIGSAPVVKRCHTRGAGTLLLGVIAGTALGCAAGAPLERWRADAETYMAAHAADANWLRDYARRSSSPDERPALLRFSTLGVSAGIGQTRDVLGVLVGFPRVGGEPWYVFLVASVKVQGGYPERADRIVAIQPVALRAGGVEAAWVVGADDPDATGRYVQAQLGAPEHESAHMLFPGRADVFLLEVAGTAVIVTERGSGARWTLELGGG